MRPLFIPSNVMEHYKENDVLEERNYQTKKKFEQIISPDPEISIVIPAYNEEKNILKTLSSIAATNCKKRIEVIVVNNNSEDKTKILAQATGVMCVTEFQKGIKYARNTGLALAKGKYVLQADADTLYPPDWIDKMISPLVENEDIALTYCSFSFIPIGATGRTTYFFYEHIADISRSINKYIKDESVNVYGFSMAFRRFQGVAIGGFDFPPGASEDGWFALKLKKNGYGKIQFVSPEKLLVWTTDRRLQIDGGLWKATMKRIKRVVSRT